MFISNNEIDADETAMKEIKVRIPVDYHWRLHTLKLTRGVHISEVVRTALNDYFLEVFDQPAPSGSE